MKTSLLIRWCLLLTSILVFAVSLTQDGFYIDHEDPARYAPCYGLLMIGWLGVLVGVYAWLANPLLILSWILTAFGPNKFAACACAVLALGFSLSFLLHKEIMAQEVGRYSMVMGYGSG